MNFLYTLILLAVLTPGKTPGAGVLSISSPISPIVPTQEARSGERLAAAPLSSWPETSPSQLSIINYQLSIPHSPSPIVPGGVQLAAAGFSSPDEDQFILNVLFLTALALATLLITGFAIAKMVVFRGLGSRGLSFEGHLSIDENMNGKDLAARVHLALSKVRGVRNVFINLSEASPTSELLARRGDPPTMTAGHPITDFDVEQALIIEELKDLEKDIHPATIKPGGPRSNPAPTK